jgi:ABC-type nitrate/sulfonate/bicarbonate transport system permease component
VLLIANAEFATPALFAAVVVLATIAVALTVALALIERRMLAWLESSTDV